MDYPYENLNPESFQQLVQGLLVREYPDVVCLPVAQPDGGRDAMAWLELTHGPGLPSQFILFQVKFVRQPERIDSPADWLSTIIEKELPKISRQSGKGASKYILVTNVRGSSHPDSGSIDKSKRLLAKAVPIPAICWWRDDLNRRMDNAWNLKWCFPQLMTGPDLIRAILENQSSKSSARRSGAIRAFVRDQFERDRQVRFKQVDLQNNLFDLFIDVPLVPPRENLPSLARILNIMTRQLAPSSSTDRGGRHLGYRAGGRPYSHYFHEERELVGTAAFLLHAIGQSAVPRLVLEGAPGQGKSTIAQYVCQIHRLRILNEAAPADLPEFLEGAPVRLPIKIDLRDLALWLGGRNPFLEPTRTESSPMTRRSLETFLAMLISFSSGGLEFTTIDLLETLRMSSILLVFDGLDEIADIDRRREVVAEIESGVSRLEENSASLQVLVTSRPAAFANSPGLREDRFPYFQLGSVTAELSLEYANKWVQARGLERKDADEVKTILKQKLQLAHLRELARNPMQLTILLSLIHTRGSSLPDKRTALYDSYMDLFFDREAEKSPVVRNHRDLLINIHRFLAWSLHGEAETGRSGSIGEQQLQKVLSDYLRSEGHDPGLVSELFSGMVERVVALVSRVQGTFEFEVQPLREYFAARHLYETAPYSPPGGEKAGTKPDRFDAIARDYYWLNVARFYAGCYSKGELPSLIDGIERLLGDKKYGSINHPRTLSLMLLADYVFAQDPNSVKRLAGSLFSRKGLSRTLFATGPMVASSEPVTLPAPCGRGSLVRACFQALTRTPSPKPDYAVELARVLRANAPEKQLDTRWRAELPGMEGGRLQKWLLLGSSLGVLARCSQEELDAILANSGKWRRRVVLTLGECGVLRDRHSEDYANALLDLGSGVIGFRSSNSALDMFACVLNPAFYRPHMTAGENLFPHPMFFDEAVSAATARLKGTRKIVATIDLANGSLRVPTDWRSSLRPWRSLITGLCKIWGERWAIVQLANLAAGVSSREDSGIQCTQLDDHSIPLVERLRFARLRSGSQTWWKRALACAGTEEAKLVSLLVLLSWGSGRTIAGLAKEIGRHLDELDMESIETLASALELALFATEDHSVSRSLPARAYRLVGEVSFRLLAFLALRGDSEVVQDDLVAPLFEYRGDNPVVSRIVQDLALGLLGAGEERADEALDIIQRTYRKDIVPRGRHLRRFLHADKVRLTERTSERILREPLGFPVSLVALAESLRRAEVARMIDPVARIAETAGWF